MTVREEVDRAVLYALQFPPSHLPYVQDGGLTDWRITMIIVDQDEPHYKLFDTWSLPDERVLFVVQRSLQRLVRQGLVVLLPNDPHRGQRPHSIGVWRRLSLLEVLAYAAR